MKQLLARVPEIIIAVDGSKVGRRHPWSFTDGGLLAGKTVRLTTDALEESQRGPLDALKGSQAGFQFIYDEVAPESGSPRLPAEEQR